MFALTNLQKNGNGRLCHRLFTRRRSPQTREMPTASFSAEDTMGLGIPIQMAMPKFFIGLGTTASKVTHGCMENLKREVGRIPSIVGYLNIDADVDGGRHARGHTIKIGVDGAGTDPVNGRGLFLEHRGQICDAFLAHLDGLFVPDPAMKTELPAKRCTSFVVVAGCGGTSGGCLDPTISMIHDVARRKQMRELRVYVALIGPKIAINDIRRSVTAAQTAMIPDTFGQNLERLYDDLAFERTVREERENGTTFALSSVDRVFSLQIIDQSNSQADFSVTEELVGMLADSLFLQHFTSAGMHHDGRFCDERRIGAYTGTSS